MEALTGTGAGTDGAAEDMLVEPEGCVAPPAAEPAKATGERSYPNRVRWHKGVELIWSDMGTTGYKGVSKVSGQELFLAQSTTGVGKGGVGLLGRFPSAEEAALCYARHTRSQEDREAEDGGNIMALFGNAIDDARPARPAPAGFAPAGRRRCDEAGFWGGDEPQHWLQ